MNLDLRTVYFYLASVLLSSPEEVPNLRLSVGRQGYYWAELTLDQKVSSRYTLPANLSLFINVNHSIPIQ